MTAKIDDGTRQPICSMCVRILEGGGFTVRFPKDAYLHMAPCSVCGKRMPVHDGFIQGRGKRRKKSFS